MIKLEHVSKSYSAGIPALNDVSLNIEEGEFVFVVGDSGSGKSTLIKLLLKELEPTEGTITINGRKLNKIRRRQIPKFRRNIGVVFQDFRLLKDRNIYDNVAFAQKVIGESNRSIKKNVPKLLSMVGLAAKYRSYPRQLSGGEQQRVAIARALATNPKILLCDEATSALDPTTTRSILALLKEINKTLGITIIVITHEMAVIEEICQRVAIIDSSRIAEVGTVDEVFTRPKSAMAKQLIYPDGKRNSLATGKRYCRIVFDGNSSFEPVVSNMVLECKAPVNIMFADTKNIDGKAYGQMILQLPEDERAAKRALAYLEIQNVHAEEVADYASV